MSAIPKRCASSGENRNEGKEKNMEKKHSTQNNEKTIVETKNSDEQKSMKVKTEETHREVSRALSEMFNKDEDLPESLLIGSARQLSNLAHSFMENRENAYLEGDQELPVVDSLRIDDICKLANAANQQMKTALDFKKERVKAAKVLAETRKIMNEGEKQ